MDDASGQPPAPGIPLDLPHDSRRSNIIVSASVSWVIAALLVVLRFYTRGIVIRVLGPTDWSILLSLVFAGATCAGVIEQAIRGSGTHIWDLDPTDTEGGMAWGRAAWYGILFYVLSLCFSKVSIVLLYIHLFSFRWARICGQILLAIVVSSSVYMMISTFTACIPLESYWDYRVPSRYCHAQSIWWSNTGLHMATDFLIFLLPMPVVWTIMLPKRQKLILCGVFGLGFVVCFISILRLQNLIQVENHPNPDFTYAAAELSYLTAVEVNGAIACACVMTLKPFVARYFPGLLSSRHSRNGGSSPRVNGSNPRSPPTIGSRPSKAPLSPVDSELGGVGPKGQRHGGGGGNATWTDGTGYVELDDEWMVDVELAEHAGHGIGNGHGGNGEVVSVRMDGLTGRVGGVDTKIYSDGKDFAARDAEGMGYGVGGDGGGGGVIKIETEVVKKMEG